MILILGVAILSGCVDNPEKIQYYNSEMKETITMYPDHTATFTYPNESGVSGTYRIDGDRVIFSIVPFGTVIEYQKKGNSLVRITDGVVSERV